MSKRVQLTREAKLRIMASALEPNANLVKTVHELARLTESAAAISQQSKTSVQCYVRHQLNRLEHSDADFRDAVLVACCCAEATKGVVGSKEKGFCRNLVGWVDEHGSLSEKQSDWLKSILSKFDDWAKTAVSVS